MSKENNIDPDIIKKTQQTLGKYVRKPQFTEKLLNKPPFRFLHDVINVVIKETGVLNGLYSKAELTSDNIKDRDSKIAFLQKLIDVIKITTNEKLSARPSKIVAGHEAENTNEMLQLLGKIVEQKLDCRKAIEKITSSEMVTPSKSSSRSKENTEKSKIKETTEKTQMKSKIPAANKKDNAKDSKDKVPKIKDVDKKIKKLTKIESTESESVKDVDKKNPQVNKAKIINANKTPDSKRVSKNVNIKDSKQNIAQKQENTKLTESKKNEHQLENNEKNKIHKIESQEIDSDKSISPKHNVKPVENSNTNKKIEDVIGNEIPIEMNNDNEIPKELPSSRKSSAPSRKSSIDKISTVNNETDSRNESDLDNLKKKHELEIDKVSSPSKTKPVANNEKKGELTQSSQSKNNENNSKTIELKRQSTFTREDSKENGSTTRPRTSLRPPSVRPASSRPGAPRRRDKNVEIILQPNDQIKLAGIQVKLESFNTELEDDGENLIIIENLNTDEVIKADENVKENIDIDENQQGHLVQQILETQKVLVQNDDFKFEYDIDTIQKRQSSAKQMDSLRDLIQNLTRSINPLGKLMDFIPEDIDSMQLEMTMWRDNYTQSTAELKKEKSLTESAIEPMQNQLSQINANIKEYTEMIDTTQAKILQNSEKIHYLLTDQ